MGIIDEFHRVSTAEIPAMAGSNSGWRHAKGQSTIAYDPPQRKGRCIAKDHTCKGWAIKGSKYCAGHAQAFKMLVKKDDG